MEEEASTSARHANGRGAGRRPQPAQLGEAIDEYLEIGGFLDAELNSRRLDLEAFERVTGAS